MQVVVVSAKSAWSAASPLSDLVRQIVSRECCRGGADRSTRQADDRVDVSKLDLDVGRLKARLGIAGLHVPEC